MGMVMMITIITATIMSIRPGWVRPQDRAAGAEPNRAMATMIIIMVITTTVITGTMSMVRRGLTASTG